MVYDAMDVADMHSFLQELMPNEPWNSPDMKHTARRWMEMMQAMGRNGTEDFEFTVFANPGHDELIIQKDIQFASLCSHHLLPFFGTCHVGYIPADNIVGLSKIPRLVHFLARGTWTQEGLTQAIANYMEERLTPVGVAVILTNVVHTCYTVRGIKERGSTTTTSAMKGAFSDHSRLARGEFLSLLNT